MPKLVEPELFLRAGTVVITPDRPGPLAGYVARGDATSVGTHDDLLASIVWLRDRNGDGFAWLTLDAIAITADLRRRCLLAFREILGPNCPPLVISASHTHSGPTGWVGQVHPGNPGATDPVALAELGAALRRLARAVRVAAPIPVRATFGTAAVPEAGANRHRPDGPRDDRVGVLTLRRVDDDRIAAVVVDHALHPTVLDAGNLRWSADWVGPAREAIMGRTGAEVVAVLQGAAGDVSTRFRRRGQGFAEATRIGAMIGAAAARAVTCGAPVCPSPSGSIKAWLHRCEIELATRSLPDPAEAEDRVRRAESALARARRDLGDHGSIRLAQVRLDGARVQQAMASGGVPPTVRLPVALAGIGDHGWIHLPVEPFAAVGLMITDAGPYRTTRVIGYTDDYLGYLPGGDVGPDHYEVLSSWFEPIAGDQLARRVLDLCRRVRR